MFDIDGTLVESYDFDEFCYIEAVKTVTGLNIDTDWSTYPHVTDSGLLKTFIERQAQNWAIDDLEKRVKKVFIKLVSEYLKTNPVGAVAGAKSFLEKLENNKEYLVSYATGGWRETALMKLTSAGIDIKNNVLTSANDHFSRERLMELSAEASGTSNLSQVTYFGDAEWDIRACEAQNVNLVIVGNRVKHHQSILNFESIEKALNYIK